jgi:hypothetical protein
MAKGYIVSWPSSTSYLSLLPFGNQTLVDAMLSFLGECFRVIYLTHYTG